MALKIKITKPRVVAPTPKSKSPLKSQPASPVLSPDLRRLVIQIVRPSDVNLWLGLPNPALGGMTPRQVIAQGQEWRLRQAIQRAIAGEPSS